MNYIFSLIACIQILYFPVDSFEVKVNVNNIEETKGTFMVAVYNSKKAYREEPFKTMKLKVKNTPEQTFILELPKGEYSIAVFQDLNENGELDKNLVGMPQEPFGFTNKSMGTMGAPSFDDTKFMLDKNGATVEINLKRM